MYKQTTLKSLVEKFRVAVEYRTHIEFSTSLNPTVENALTLRGADAKVEAAEAMLLAAAKDSLKTNGKLD